MSNHSKPTARQEIIQASEDNLPNPFLNPLWPDDIPQGCPRCGKTLHPKINLSYGLGKLGRASKFTAWWITIPWIPIVFFVVLPWLMTLPSGNGAGFALSLLFLVPAAVFSFITRLCPRSRRVQCYPCKYSKDYPATAKHLDPDPKS